MPTTPAAAQRRAILTPRGIRPVEADSLYSGHSSTTQNACRSREGMLPCRWRLQGVPSGPERVVFQCYGPHSKHKWAHVAAIHSLSPCCGVCVSSNGGREDRCDNKLVHGCGCGQSSGSARHRHAVSAGCELRSWTQSSLLSMFARRTATPSCFYCLSPQHIPPRDPLAFHCDACRTYNQYSRETGEIIGDEPAMRSEMLNSGSFSKRGTLHAPHLLD